MRKFLSVILFFGLTAHAIADDQCPMGYMPAKYTQLEYIESTGTQYIDTGVYPDSDFSYELAFSNYTIPTNDEENGMFGETSGSWADMIGVNQSQVKPRSNVIPYMKYDGVESTLTQKTEGTFLLTKDNFYYNGTAVFSRQAPTFDKEAYSIYLFCLNKQGQPTRDAENISSSLSAFRVHYFTTRYLSILVQNLIPVRRNLDGEIGMFDTVTGHFFTNAGTGEFIAGPEILTENTCFPCPPNTYKDFVGNGDCTPCPDTFSSPSGATSINECGRILHIGDYVAHMPVGKRTEHGLCTMFDGKKYCADVYERQ